MKFSKIILTILATLSLAACSTESNKKKDIVLNSPHDFEHTGNFQVSTFRVIHSALQSFNSYGLPGAKVFTFEACLTDQLNAAIKEPNLLFSVSDPSGTKEMVRTHRQGCLVWTETHSFSYLLPETYFRIKRVITSHNYYKGSVEAVGAFNPWLDGASSLEDTRYKVLAPDVQVEELGSLSIHGAHLRSRPDTVGIKMNLTGVNFNFLGHDHRHHEVTPRLALRVAHRYHVRLSPVVFRRTLSNIAKPESLIRGSLKVTLVILQEDSNKETQFAAKNVIASTEFEKEINAGQLATEISILFPEIVSLTSRTVALLTITPTDEIDGLPSLSFTGSLKPGPLSSLDLIPVNLDATELHQQFQKKLNDEMSESSSALALLKRNPSYRALSSDIEVVRHGGLLFSSREPLVSIIEAQLKSPASSYWPHVKVSLFTLCGVIFPADKGAQSTAAACRRNPASYLEYKFATFLDRLNSPTAKAVGEPEVITMTMNATTSWSSSHSKSVGATASMGFNFGSDFSGLKFSFGSQISNAYLVKVDKSDSVNVNRSRTITAEERSYEIDAMTRRCLVVKPHKNLDIKFLEGAVGVYHCLPAKSEKRIETYYQVNSNTGLAGSAFTDNADPSSTHWRMMIRGPKTLNLFASVIDKPLYKIIFEDPKPEAEAYEAITHQYLTEEFPGVFSE